MVDENSKSADEKPVVDTEKLSPHPHDADIEHVEDIKIARAELVVPLPKPQPESAPVVPLLEIEGASEGQPSGRQRSDTLDDLPRQGADQVPLKVVALWFLSIE